MMYEKDMEIGQRVQFSSGSNWKPFGVITEKQPPIKMNGTILVSARYKARWDNGDESGWLHSDDFKVV